MAALNPINTNALTGTPIVFTGASSGGDTFQNGGTERLIVKNGGASAITVTIAAQAAAPPPYTLANQTITVAAGAEVISGPFTTQHFNNAGGSVAVTYSSTTSVTVSVIR